MTEDDIRMLERYSKRELIGMLEAIAGGHLELERENRALKGKCSIYRHAFLQVQQAQDSDAKVCPITRAVCAESCAMWDESDGMCRVVDALDALRHMDEEGVHINGGTIDTHEQNTVYVGGSLNTYEQN